MLSTNADAMLLFGCFLDQEWELSSHRTESGGEDSRLGVKRL